MRFEYAGGVLDSERDLITRFEDDVVPYVTRNGGRIGEMAMAGDQDCEEVIRRYAMVVQGMPEYRGFHYKALVTALKKVELKLCQ